MERREYHAMLERRVGEATRDLAAALNELEDTYRATLEALGSALDTRDVGTHAHSRRVVGYSLTLARTHGLPDSQFRDIEHGVLLHDIGKIGIPDGILLKPGPLSSDEWKIMRTHPDLGRRLVERIPFLRGAVPIVYHHHERWDGTGYPLGLRGEMIPLGARIFAVADAFDAMTFDRPYSVAISFDAPARRSPAARDALRSQRGGELPQDSPRAARDHPQRIRRVAAGCPQGSRRPRTLAQAADKGPAAAMSACAKRPYRSTKVIHK